MNHSLRNITLGALLGVVLLGCDSSIDPDDDPAGITVTAENGTIFQDDMTDWQPRVGDESALLVTFHPASPNPASKRSDISFTILEPADISFMIVDEDGRTILKENFNEKFPGLVALAWGLLDDAGNPVPSGLYRVRFSVVSHADPTHVVESFGDIEVKR